jgi:hypothetical protein
MKLLFIPLLLLIVPLQGQMIGRHSFGTKTGTVTSTLLNGIVAYYKMNESSGSVLDAVGSSNGTNVGATANQTGKLGTGYVFGANDSIIMGNTSALSSLTGDGSISAWIYPTGQAASYSIIVSKMDYNNDLKGYILWQQGLNIRAGGGSATGADYIADGNVSVTKDAWTLIVYTWDVVAGTMKIYKNGDSPYVDNGLVITFVSNYAGFQIGHNSYYGTSFVGTLDEVGLWDRALTDAEVLELYNSGTGKTYPF